MQTYDAIVIGAGVVGCSIALSLNRAGIKSLNIDALPAPGYGSTSHSSAIIRPFYSHTTAAALAHESRYRWLAWADYLQLSVSNELARYTESGGTILYTQAELESYQANLQALDEVGVEYSHLSQAEISNRLPGIDLQGYGPPRRTNAEDFGQPNQAPIIGAIHIPACGYVNDPQLAAQNLFRAATQSGAQFLFATKAHKITQTEGGHCITLSDGETVEAAYLVNAAGPHSGHINTLAGVNVPIKTSPHRHEVAYVQSPFAEDVGFVVDMDNGTYQRSDGNDLLIGSVDPACDPVQLVDPDQPEQGFSDQWTHQVYRAGLRFPALGIESQARGTIGIYDVSEDWIPLYDKSERQGYYLAIGTSGNQFKNAPLIGDLVTSIITHPYDHDTQPAHLHLEQTNRLIDLSFYSRLRQPNATASVLA